MAVRVSPLAMLQLLVLFLSPAWAVAEEARRPPQATKEAADKEVLARAAQLVQQLGSKSFPRREAASQELARLGWPARPAILAGLKSVDVETRLRCQRVLSMIEQNDFQLAVDALLADRDGTGEHRLPAWPLYREKIGADQPARELFVKMLKAEGDLLTAIEKNPQGAGNLFGLRCQQLQNNSTTAGEEIPPGSLGAMLLAASLEEVPMPLNTESFLYRFCSHSGVRLELKSEHEQPSPMRRLVGAWVVSGRGGYFTLRLAMEYDLEEGLIAAEKMLSENTPGYYKQYAILTFAKLGTRQHVPLLEPLLADTAVCSMHRVNNVTYQTQFRDVALAAVLHLYGQDPQKFGFDSLRTNEQYVFSPYTMGFESEEKRAAAFAKWEAYKKSLTVGG